MSFGEDPRPGRPSTSTNDDHVDRVRGGLCEPTQCYEWFEHFKEGRMSFGDDPTPGPTSTSTNDDHID